MSILSSTTTGAKSRQISIEEIEKLGFSCLDEKVSTGVKVSEDTNVYYYNGHTNLYITESNEKFYSWTEGHAKQITIYHISFTPPLYNTKDAFELDRENQNKLTLIMRQCDNLFVNNLQITNMSELFQAVKVLKERLKYVDDMMNLINLSEMKELPILEDILYKENENTIIEDDTKN